MSDVTRNLGRNLLLSFVVFTVTLAAVGVAGEYAVRRRERTRETVPGTMPFLFYRESRYGHALVRNKDYFGWVHINSRGFRGAEISPEKPPGLIRIVVMGGSTTFDTYVRSDTLTWPMRMQHWLRELAPQSKVEVVNAGVPGYVIADDFLRLQTDIAGLQPDVIIQLHGHNDLFRAFGLAAATAAGGTTGGATEQPRRESRPGEVPTTFPGVRWLERHSLLYSKVAPRFLARGRRGSSSQRASPIDWPRAVDYGTKRFEREMTAFAVTGKMLGAHVVLSEAVHAAGVGRTRDTTIIRMWQNAVAAPVDTTLWAYERFNAATRQSAVNAGALFVPATEWGISGTKYYAPDDPVHFNDAGADLMGRRMAEALIRLGVLSGPSAPQANKD